MHRIHPEHKAFSRALRSMPTEAERCLWQRLRSKQLKGAKFRRQHPLGRYVLDFVCLDLHLVIEVDGGQHGQNEHDAVRDAWLAGQGFRVLRFWNNEVMGNRAGVFEVISAALASASGTYQPPPQPSTSPLASGSDSPGERQSAGTAFCPGSSPLQGEGA